MQMQNQGVDPGGGMPRCAGECPEQRGARHARADRTALPGGPHSSVHATPAPPPNPPGTKGSTPAASMELRPNAGETHSRDAFPAMPEDRADGPPMFLDAGCARKPPGPGEVPVPAASPPAAPSLPCCNRAHETVPRPTVKTRPNPPPKSPAMSARWNHMAKSPRPGPRRPAGAAAPASDDFRTIRPSTAFS